MDRTETQGCGDELAQMNTVRQRYQDTPLWLKAPNGKVSNLTEAQWLEARTPDFKNRFGDWEAAALIDMAKKVWRGDMQPRRFNFLPSQKLKGALAQLQGRKTDMVYLTDSDIRHFKSRHGADEGQHGQTDLTPEDTALIPFVLNEFDAVSKEKPDNKGGLRLKFSKQINGTAFAVSIERGTHKEQLVTFYKKKGRVPHANIALGQTSETTPSEETVTRAAALRNAKKLTRVDLDENGEPVFRKTGATPFVSATPQS